MSITGKPEDGPLRVGFPLADTIGGLTAAMAISAALNKRPRGQMVDVSMLDSVLTTMGWVVSNYLIGGVIPAQQGNENITSAPSGTFQTSYGLINIAANEERQWLALVAHLNCPHLAKDSRFVTRDNRKIHRYELIAELEPYLKNKSALEWEVELTAIGVPAGVVMTVPEILAHPHIAHRGLLAEFENVQGLEQSISVMRTGFQSDGQPASVDTPPPVIGEHNNEILRELGYDGETIEQLRQKGII